MEFIMLVGGVILFVSLVFLLINGSLIPQAEEQIINHSKNVSDMLATLKATPN